MILGVIPARGGSKGIPRKNLKPLCGKPLIMWTIEAAQKSKLLDRIIVSTEDFETKLVSIAANVEVLDRPEELASDTATTLEVLQDVLRKIPADVIVLLQPTSPMRGIDTALGVYFREKCDTLATGSWVPTGEWKDDNTPRQQLPRYFKDNGCVYIFDAKVIESGRWMGDKPYRMETPSIYNLDIDTLEDFWAVEGIMNHWIE